MNLTPKALELLRKLELNKNYSMACMGDLIFERNDRHSRQTMALKAGRFARQLIDAGHLYYDNNRQFYRKTNKEHS